MQKTFSERMVSRLLAFGKKYRWSKYLVLGCIFVVLGITYLKKSMVANTKKLSLACLFVCFFFTSSSFNFPTVSKNDLVDVKDYVEEQAIISLDSTGFSLYDPAVAEQLQKEDVSVEEMEEGSIEEGSMEGTGVDGVSTDSDVEDAEVQELQPESYTLEDILAQMEQVSANSEAVSYADSGTTFDKNDWNLLLVNKQHPIPEGTVEPNLVAVAGEKKCDERVVGELLSMVQAAREDGVTLMICSAHRSYDYQVMLFQRKITKYMRYGYSYLDAYEMSSQAVTLPGYSEHQLGLAFDIVQPSYVNLNDGFADTAAGKWLKENAYKYGFILRYPKGKEYITGIEFEPWHYRYVGVEAATIIMENEITLEEFIDHLEDYVCTHY